MSVTLNAWPDLLVVGLVVSFAFFAIRRGFVTVLAALIGFIASLTVSFALYSNVAGHLENRLGWSPVWGRPLAFVGLWLITELLFSSLGRVLARGLKLGDTGRTANRALAVVPGAMQGLVFSALLLTILAVLPVGGDMRRSIVDSAIGSRLVNATLAVERPLEGVFGPAARETLGFITINPPVEGGEHGESLQLNFSTGDAPPVPEEEDAMLALVNKERTSRGLVALEMDPELRLLARAHAADMFKRGYFSHNTPEGADPFDRMRSANIIFGLAGENLALAPTLDMAHTGLMNSPGHRANILRDGFRKVGIGVLNGGIYGKMFVQEFTD